MSIPSMPRASAANSADERADDLADGQEYRVEAHDRAAVVGEALGDVGQQPECGWRRARHHEQPERGHDCGAEHAPRSADRRSG